LTRECLSRPGLRFQVLFWTVLLWASSSPSQELKDSISALLDGSNPAARAFWGIQVVDLSSGQTLFEHNPARFFIPASNTKLFTTALGLTRLGPGFRFRTAIVADQPPDSNGRIAGDIYLIGGGDPNLSGRTIPYRVGAPAGDPLQAVEKLADLLVTRGIRRIDGRVVGDDSAYPWDPYPDGWSMDDGVWEYGAPVSALTVNDGVISVRIRPGVAPGSVAALSLNPPVEYFQIDNRVRTVEAGQRKIWIDRLGDSPQLRLWGHIPLKDPGESQDLAVDDPARFAASLLRDALLRRGIQIAGEAAAKHSYLNGFENLDEIPSPPIEVQGTELASLDSAPLSEDLRIINKVSQNLHAEMLLRAVAKSKRNIGSRQAGLDELRGFLAELGAGKQDFSFQDGSGLSRLNLITPSLVVKLLKYMHNSPHRESWMSSLPVGGEDGTLQHRFKGTAALARVRAKTGTLSHVSALSGYIDRPDGRMLAFSILANNFNTSTAEARNLMDKIANAMLR